MSGESKKFSYGERMTAMMLASWWGRLSDHLGIEHEVYESFNPEMVLAALRLEQDEIIEANYLFSEGLDYDEKCYEKYTMITGIIDAIVNQDRGHFCPPYSGISEDDEADRLADISICRHKSNERNIDYQRPSKTLAVWQKLSELLHKHYGKEEYKLEWQELMGRHFGGYSMGKYSA
jgi:hypothetical protein